MKQILKEEDEDVEFTEEEQEDITGQVLISLLWNATIAMILGIFIMNVQRKDFEQTLLTQVKKCC